MCLSCRGHEGATRLGRRLPTINGVVADPERCPVFRTGPCGSVLRQELYSLPRTRYDAAVTRIEQDFNRDREWTVTHFLPPVV